MSTSVLEEKTICDNLDCGRTITGFPKQKNERFCMRCQWSKLPKRWKCKRKDCPVILDSDSVKTTRFFCSHVCALITKKERYKTQKQKESHK